MRFEGRSGDGSLQQKHRHRAAARGTFSRHLRYSLDRSDRGTDLRVEDEVAFKGLGKLAAPVAARDIGKRWETSLHNLKAAAEQQQ